MEVIFDNISSIIILGSKETSDEDYWETQKIGYFIIQII